MTHTVNGPLLFFIMLVISVTMFGFTFSSLQNLRTENTALRTRIKNLNEFNKQLIEENDLYFDDNFDQAEDLAELEDVNNFLYEELDNILQRNIDLESENATCREYWELDDYMLKLPEDDVEWQIPLDQHPNDMNVLYDGNNEAVVFSIKDSDKWMTRDDLLLSDQAGVSSSIFLTY